MIDCKVCCKICEQTFCRYAGTQRGLEVECRYYMPKQKPQTNADRIRAMSDEELAKFLCSILNCESEKCPGVAYCALGKNGCADWLRQPAKDGGNDG